jgi:hypothetical protein
MAAGDLILSIESAVTHPGTDNLMDLGESALEFKNLYLDGILFADEIQLETTEKIQFRDSGIHIESLDDGHLDLTADTSIDLNGNIILGSASTSSLTCTGRLIVRTLGSDPQDVTPANRPAGSVAEIAYYCTNASTPTWEKITSG